MRTSPARISGTEKRLFADLRELVLSAKRRVAATVNSEIVLLYWSIGMRIKTDILKNRRAAYGEELVLRVATFLSDEFGSGWGFQTVRHCVRAAYAIDLDAPAIPHGYRRQAQAAVLSRNVRA